MPFLSEVVTRVFEDWAAAELARGDINGPFSQILGESGDRTDQHGRVYVNSFRVSAEMHQRLRTGTSAMTREQVPVVISQLSIGQCAAILDDIVSTMGATIHILHKDSHAWVGSIEGVSGEAQAATLGSLVTLLTQHLGHYLWSSNDGQ